MEMCNFLQLVHLLGLQNINQKAFVYPLRKPHDVIWKNITQLRDKYFANDFIISNFCFALVIFRL